VGSDAFARCRSSKAIWLRIVLLVLLHVWQTAAGVCWVRVVATNVQQHVHMWLLNELIARHRLLSVASCQGAFKVLLSMQSCRSAVTWLSLLCTRHARAGGSMRHGVECLGNGSVISC
jgi:hypothetical protein